MPTALITGCDYGIGFEFARQLGAADWRVHAVCLLPQSRERLEGLGHTVEYHHADVAREAQIRTLSSRLSGQPIDLLVNNAATFAPDGPGALELPDMGEFSRVMRVNAVAPIYVAEAFTDHVAASLLRKMVFISTRSGSIGDNSSGGHYAYRCSKAALNMAVKSISVDLAERGIISVALHPGSVRTETRKGGQVSVCESVAGMRRIIDNLSIADSGTFQRFDGGTIEW